MEPYGKILRVVESNNKATCYECGEPIQKYRGLSVGYIAFLKCYCFKCVGNFLYGEKVVHITWSPRLKNHVRFEYRSEWIQNRWGEGPQFLRPGRLVCIPFVDVLELYFENLERR
jgi:hypothetical protein